ncbi:MAG: type III pantothenate kinase [Saprospiraceae bacterium]
MNLIIDMGNTRTKLAIFKHSTLVHKIAIENSQLNSSILEKIEKEFEPAKYIMTYSGKLNDDVFEFLQKKPHFILLDQHTPIPIINGYETPATLGKDRLSAVVAAHNLFPDSHCLVIDCGTCITYNFIDKQGKFEGGSISPGLHMRFKALHKLTAKLPMVEPGDAPELIGKNTEMAIRIGAQNGAILEMDAFIQSYLQRFPEIKTLLTGGDAHFFELRLKNKIFADENLVLKGLNDILNFNSNTQ